MKRKTLLYLALLLFIFPSCSDDLEFSGLQEEVETSLTLSDENLVITCPIEISASPIGGYQKLYDDIDSRKKYPVDRKNLKGKVYVSFVVNENGQTSSFEVIKGIDEKYDAEALRLMRTSLTEWEAGHVNGVNVRQRMVIPIAF